MSGVGLLREAVVCNRGRVDVRLGDEWKAHDWDGATQLEARRW
jgi:hypothetical protein